MTKATFRSVTAELKDEYDRVVKHPLQAWEWGEFRKQTGVEVIRRGIFSEDALIGGFQLTIHKLPHTPWSIGYLPKSSMLDKPVLEELDKIGEDHNCIFIKLEPAITKEKKDPFPIPHSPLLESPHPLFTKYTFQIDLTKTEQELMQQMNSKTRYNVRLAERRGVEVVEDNSQEAFEEYLRLLMETTKRQNFFAHDQEYHRKLWQTLHPAGIAHLLRATYQGKTLVAWIVFLFNGLLYYPYGASSSEHREVMASNRMMWEAMLWGKKQGAKIFDLWGSLGPQPDRNNPWYGFHRFKQGYGGELVEFVGSYDLVLNPLLYSFYNAVHKLRWTLLRR